MRILRESRGYSQIKLAKKTNIPVEMINQYENGEAIPPYEHLVKLSKALKVSHGTLLRFLELDRENAGYEYDEILKLVNELRQRGITKEIILEYAKFEDECIKKGFTFKSLLEAREKQIPMKVTPLYGYMQTGICPRCGSWLLPEETHNNYCKMCGQRLEKV